MDEKKELEKIITEMQAALEVATQKLAELEKPKLKLKHGDYGVHGVGSNWFAGKRFGELEIFGTMCGSGQPPAEENLNRIVLGNIIDDLNRNSEDLREFNGKDIGRATENNEVNMVLDGPFICYRGDHYVCYDIKQATAFNQKLAQMLATAKREQDGK